MPRRAFRGDGGIPWADEENEPRRRGDTKRRVVVPPQELEPITTATAEHEQMTRKRIVSQSFSDQGCQRIKAAAACRSASSTRKSAPTPAGSTRLNLQHCQYVHQRLPIKSCTHADSAPLGQHDFYGTARSHHHAVYHAARAETKACCDATVAATAVPVSPEMSWATAQWPRTIGSAVPVLVARNTEPIPARPRRDNRCGPSGRLPATAAARLPNRLASEDHTADFVSSRSGSRCRCDRACLGRRTSAYRATQDVFRGTLTFFQQSAVVS